MLVEAPPAAACFCGKRIIARGLCQAHYRAWRRAVVPDPRTHDAGSQKRRVCGECGAEYAVYARRRVHSELCASCRLNRERQGYIAIDEARAANNGREQICCACGASSFLVTVDFIHLIPPGRGGGNGPENLVSMCSTCRTSSQQQNGTGMRPVSFRLPGVLVTQLYRLAEAKGRTASSIVREAVSDYVSRG